MIPTLLESIRVPPEIKVLNFKRKQKEFKSAILDEQSAESLFVVRGEGIIKNNTVAIVQDIRHTVYIFDINLT